LCKVLFEDQHGVAWRVAEKCGAEPSAVSQEFETKAKTLPTQSPAPPQPAANQDLQRIINTAQQKKEEMGDSLLAVDHFVMCLHESKEASQVLSRLGPKKETMELPGGRVATYYVADFEKKTATKVDRARVRWAWTTDGTWIAPDNPRWQFARQLATVPVLYKVYVVTPLPDEAEDRPADDATTTAFVAACWTQYAAAFGQ